MTCLRLFGAGLALFVALAGGTGCRPSNPQGNGTASSLHPQAPCYDSCFTHERLRMDFIFTGGADRQEAFLKTLYREPAWVGSPNGLIDPFGYGDYYVEAFDQSGTQLLFSKGFSSLFLEWRSTLQAEAMEMAYSQSIWMPFPKEIIQVVLYARNDQTGRFQALYRCQVDPADKLIRAAETNDYSLTAVSYRGDPAHKVDLVFAGEGYAREDMAQFHQDVDRMSRYLFSMEPYKSRQGDFNVWRLDACSEESGVSIPQEDRWVNTVCRSHFYTFYEDRYLTIPDHSRLADMLSRTPFDAVIVLANDDKYGGGGIYNSYALGTAGNDWAQEVFIHEFGHSFAGLDDEYYTSAVPYGDQLLKNRIEPWGPNVTNQVDFASKWQDMIEPGTPLPTPNDSAYMGVVGLFEGARYLSQGYWRPALECRMKNNTAPAFCPVCQRAINRMIDHYVD